MHSIQTNNKLLPEIHPTRAAVSSQSGSIRFYVKAQPGWHSVYSDSDESVRAIVEVPSITLEDIIKMTDQRPIDLLKIDCEGGEFDIIKSNPQLLSNYVNRIAMEYHETGERTLSQLTTDLDACGFKIEVNPHKQWHTGMLYAWNRQKV